MGTWWWIRPDFEYRCPFPDPPSLYTINIHPYPLDFPAAGLVGRIVRLLAGPPAAAGAAEFQGAEVVGVVIGGAARVGAGVGGCACWVVCGWGGNGGDTMHVYIRSIGPGPSVNPNTYTHWQTQQIIQHRQTD